MPNSTGGLRGPDSSFDDSMGSGTLSAAYPATTPGALFEGNPSTLVVNQLQHTLYLEQILSAYKKQPSQPTEELLTLSRQSGILPEILTLLACAARVFDQKLVVRTSNPLNIPIYAALDHSWTAAKPMSVKAKSSPDLGIIPTVNGVSKALNLAATSDQLLALEKAIALPDEAESTPALEALLSSTESLIKKLRSNRDAIAHSQGHASGLAYPLSLVRTLLDRDDYECIERATYTAFCPKSENAITYYAVPITLEKQGSELKATTLAGDLIPIGAYAEHFHDQSNLQLMYFNAPYTKTPQAVMVFCDSEGRLFIPDCDIVDLARPLLHHEHADRDVRFDAERGYVSSNDVLFIEVIQRACQALELPCPILHGKEKALAFSTETTLPVEFPVVVFAGDNTPQMARSRSELNQLTGKTQPLSVASPCYSTMRDRFFQNADQQSTAARPAPPGSAIQTRS